MLSQKIFRLMSKVALFAIVFLLRLWFGFEASSLRRWRLDASGWRLADAFVADDMQDAETRFFERFGGQTAPIDDAENNPPHATRPAPTSHIGAKPEIETQRSPVRPAGLPPTGPTVIGY